MATVVEMFRDSLTRLSVGRWPLPSPFAGYVWVALVIAAALALCVLPGDTPFLAMLFCYPLVALSAVLFGAGPGLVTLALSEILIAAVLFPLDRQPGGGRDYAIALAALAASAGLVSVVIGRRRGVQRRLADIEEKLRRLLAGAHVGIAQIEAGGLVLEANGAFAMMTGYRVRDRLRGAPPVADGDTELIAADGSALPVHLHRIRFFSGGAEQGWWLIEDLRERRATDARIARLLREQRAVIENPQIGIGLQQGSRIVWANKAMANMFGYPLEEFLTMRSDDLYWSREARELTKRDAAQVCARGEVYHGLVKGRRRDGTSCWVEITSSPVGDRATNEWVVTAADVSERRRIDREFIEAANRERAALGHDLHDGLGQELTGMSLLVGGLADRLRRGQPVDLAQVERLEAIAARATSACRGIARGLVPLGDLGTSLVSALTDYVAVEVATYGLDVRFVPALHAPLRLSADGQDQLFRIAQEALANARRHAGATKIEIGLEVEADTVQLTIRDDGCGVPGGSRQGGGLGLKIMGRRAERIGGTLLVAPNPAGGTIVTCRCFQVP
jgi:PAS domain S-box-containing protein